MLKITGIIFFGKIIIHQRQLVSSTHESEKIEQLFTLSLGTHLFVKVLRPGDSKGTFSVFESSCHLLLPV